MSTVEDVLKVTLPIRLELRMYLNNSTNECRIENVLKISLPIKAELRIGE